MQGTARPTELSTRVKGGPSPPQRPVCRRSGTDSGSILIIILWISLGLVAVTLLFGQSMMLRFRSSDNQLASHQAAQAVEGAARYVQYVLANLEVPNQLPEEDNYLAEQVPLGDGYFWLLARDEDDLTGGTVRYGLTDERGKLDLNTATAEMLALLPRMTPSFAAAIVDWRDEDEEPGENGAESQNYAWLSPAYQCKNAPFETVDELRLVQGATWEILYGEDANRNGLLDANESDGETSWPPDNGDSRLDPGIVEYVTVYGAQTATEAEGGSQTDVNGEGEALGDLLRETFGEERGEEIFARAGSGSREFESLLEFYEQSGMTPEEFAEVDDSLIVGGDEDRLQVNVNTASATVLACLPGMDEQSAAQLIARRQGSTEGLDSLAWVGEVLDAEIVSQVAEYLTTSTTSISADVVAVGRHGRGHRRTFFVFDLTGDAPEIVYRRDLSGSGWSLGTTVFEDLARSRKSAR